MKTEYIEKDGCLQRDGVEHKEYAVLYLRLEIRAVLDFVSNRKLVRFKYALYTVSVRQTEALPAGTLPVPTSDLLQIPPRDGYPCLRLTVPTARSVADFHRQVIAHAERTTY